MSKKLFIIVNPKSGGNRGYESFRLLKNVLEGDNINFEYVYTQYPGQASEIAFDVREKSYDAVVSVGGDGTAHQVINGLIGSGNLFGLIPAGSGNDFAKAADIPLDIHSSIKTLINFKSKLIDLGKLDDNYFINGLGIGVDGAISFQFHKLKRYMGQFGYIVGSIIEAITFRGFQAEVDIDDLKFNDKLLLTGASNGRFQGGKFQLAPGAVVDDGLLDFHIIEDMPLFSRLNIIPRALDGKHVSYKQVHIHQSKIMNIKLKSEIPAHMDGESFYLKPGNHRIEVVPGKLKIISG